MSGMVLKVEFLPGTHIRSAVQDALRLAKTLNVNIDFKFNDVSIFVTPRHTEEEVLKKFYMEALND